MSTVELAIQKVRELDEPQALKLMEWLRGLEPEAQDNPAPLGARAMLGFARQFRSERRTTADWMADLREGENSDGMGD